MLLGWQLQRQRSKWMRGDQRGRQGQAGDDQQSCGTTESWYGHGSRSDGCVRSQKSLIWFSNKCLCIQNVNLCIDTHLDKQ